MSPLLAVLIFSIVLAVLGILIAWEYRRLRRPPGIDPEKLRARLSAPLFPYTPPRDTRGRSMERTRTA